MRTGAPVAAASAVASQVAYSVDLVGVVLVGVVLVEIPVVGRRSSRRQAAGNQRAHPPASQRTSRPPRRGRWHKSRHS